jgi:hypothetical protein
MLPRICFRSIRCCSERKLRLHSDKSKPPYYRTAYPYTYIYCIPTLHTIHTCCTSGRSCVPPAVYLLPCAMHTYYCVMFSAACCACMNCCAISLFIITSVRTSYIRPRATYYTASLLVLRSVYVAGHRRTVDSPWCRPRLHHRKLGPQLPFSSAHRLTWLQQLGRSEHT